MVVKVIKEWGGCKFEIMYIVFVIISGVNMFGVDYVMVKFFGLKLIVKCVMFY